MVPEERLCTPLQAAWEKILIDEHPQFTTRTPDRLDSFHYEPFRYLDATNHNIKDLIETPVLLLRAYDGHCSYYPSLQVVQVTLVALVQRRVGPKRKKFLLDCTTSFLGHSCGHATALL